MKNNLTRPFIISGFTALLSSMLSMVTGNIAFIVLFTVCLIIYAVLRYRKSDYARHMAVICLTTALTMLSFMNAYGKYEATLVLEAENAEISGTVVSMPTKSGGATYMTELSDCTVNGIEAYGKIYLYTYSLPDIEAGDEILASDCDTTRNTSTGIFRYHALSSGGYLTAFSENVSVTKQHSDKNILNIILSLRSFTTEKLYKNMSEDAAEITNALITGDKSSASDTLLSGFRKSGISHIFAVSGMHLTMWTAVFFLVLKYRAKSRLVPNALATAFILFYIVFTGFSPSVLRAGFMLIPAFIGAAVHKKSDTLNTLGLSGTVLILLNPFLAGNVSFLLSFLATFALIGITPYFRISGFFRKYRFIIPKTLTIAVINSLITSVCVIFVTLPVASAFFGYISLLSPLSSLIMTPVAELLMISGAISIFIPSGNFLSSLIFSISEFLSQIILKYVTFASEPDFVIFPVKDTIVIPWFIITVIITAVLVFIVKSRKKATVFMLISAVIIAVISGAYAFSFYGKTELYASLSDDDEIITISESGIYSAVYSGKSTYSAIRSASSQLASSGFADINLLISEENGKHENLLRSAFLPDVTIPLYSDGEPVSGNRINLWKDAYIYHKSYYDYSAYAVFLGDCKIVFLTSEKTDLSEIDSIFLDGDILVCRDNIPINSYATDFSEIIIHGRKSDSISADTHTTSSDKPLKITIEGEKYAIH